MLLFMKAMTIGEVAKAAEIGVETVRFYEREGLIAEPPRRRSGYRQYPADTVRRLRFIRRAKELGFTLAEIGELLDLARIQAALTELVRTCRGKGPTSDCPILDALDEQEVKRGDR